MTVDIEGTSKEMEFEVIEIFDDSNPYPRFLRIDWATNMNGFTNLKKHKMIFEKNSLRIVVPLDPVEGACYINPVCDDQSNDELDYIYQITARD